jgi:hypothetical protein
VPETKNTKIEDIIAMFEEGFIFLGKRKAIVMKF